MIITILIIIPITILIIISSASPSVARELESHISSFARRVEGQRHVLELAVLFYSHVEELGNWFGELKAELGSEEVTLQLVLMVLLSFLQGE